MDGLASDGERDGALRIPFDTVYGMEAFERIELGMPPNSEPVTVALRSRGYVRRGGGFEILASIARSDGTVVPASARIGGWVRAGNGGFLVSPEVFRLVRRLDQGCGDSLEEQHRFIAEVVREAEGCQAQLDSFLGNQEYLTPEGVGFEVEVESADRLILRPVAEGIQERFPEFENGTWPVRTSYSKREGGKRRRLLLSEEQKQAASELSAGREIRGADVPKFIDNPDAFLPDAIDLSRFSPRVRGLIPRRYRSQPYLDVREGKESRDWFTVSPRVEMLADDGLLSASLFDGPTVEGDAGLERREDPGPADPVPAVEPGVYAELCRAVLETGEPNVLHNGSWIHIDPVRAELFLAALGEAAVTETGELRIPRDRIGYVLDVISNVDQVEFGLVPQGPTLIDPPDYDLPLSLKAQLYPHQEFGYRWLRYLHEKGLGGLLADDMGLGKTVQVAALLAFLHEEGALGPSLLVVPNSLVPNWRQELEKFCPVIRAIHEHHGTHRVRDPGFLGTWDIVITTYGTLRRDQLVLGEVDWKVIACDEAQNVKNPTTQVTSAVKGMKADVRLALTGTPVENGLSELWCIVDYVQPAKLGSWSEFRNEFERPMIEASDEEQQRIAHRLQVELDPHYVRRLKGDVLADLPGKTEERAQVNLSEVQKGQYAAIIKRLRDGDLIPLQALQLLIQLCSHPSLLGHEAKDGADYIAMCPKLECTVSILDSIRDAGERAVIFTRYRRMQAILQEVLADRFGIFAPIINGEDSGRARQGRVDAFNRVHGFGVLILSPEAAGVGLNITGANHVIHYTRLWNPARENQATDRVHRLGQERPVTVHYPIVAGQDFRSIEQHMDELLAEKSRLADNVLWPRESLSVVADLERALTREGS